MNDVGSRTSTDHQADRRVPDRTIRSQQAPRTNHTSPTIQETFRALPTHVLTILPLDNVLVARRGFADRNTLAGKHALVHDSVTSEEEEIGGYETELRRDQVDDVSDHQLARVLLNPCQGRERSAKRSPRIRTDLTCTANEYVYRARESRHLSHARNRL